jgi:hypothetical protein
VIDDCERWRELTSWLAALSAKHLKKENKKFTGWAWAVCPPKSAFASKAVIQVNPILALALRLSASGGGRVGPAIGKVIPKAKRSAHRHPGVPRGPFVDIVEKPGSSLYRNPKNFPGQIYCRSGITKGSGGCNLRFQL